MSSLILPRNMDSEASAVGAWNLGACAALLLQGVLCAQVAHYTTRNKRDSIWMKLFVVGLTLMITLNAMHAIGMIWIQSVTTFGDMKGGSNIWHNHWVWKPSLAHSLCRQYHVATYILSLSAPLCLRWHLFPLLLCGSASGGCGLRRSRFDWQHDILLAPTLARIYPRPRARPQPSSTPYSGSQCRQVKSEHANSETQRFTIIKPQSAVPATLSASINFATEMALRSTAWNPVLLGIAIVANMALPQLYAWSAMWTLNSREDIHLAAQNCPYTIDLGALSSEHKGLPSFNAAGPEPETEDLRTHIVIPVVAECAGSSGVVAVGTQSELESKRRAHLVKGKPEYISSRKTHPLVEGRRMNAANQSSATRIILCVDEPRVQYGSTRGYPKANPDPDPSIPYPANPRVPHYSRYLKPVGSTCAEVRVESVDREAEVESLATFFGRGMIGGAVGKS
ncbi:hypothetical protein B0H14DRAFT_2616048 [Mycena olivaceomarginata]|nr:hypothetical protein B0H14DRAFT_2616048 [Mycena olivaceomarginata]